MQPKKTMSKDEGKERYGLICSCDVLNNHHRGGGDRACGHDRRTLRAMEAFASSSGGREQTRKHLSGGGSSPVQLKHGSGDDDMDDTLVMYAAAEDLENDGKEVVPSKKAKGCDTVRSPIGTRRHKMEEEAALKRTRVL
ncbi:hypothetical protein Bca52824_017903 [Brassica carinata]|uniref:Uncharacterized protein n=1 Tax=Brassica carinata TaxID=52824 RepID=A0A8X7VNZ3_BRACI|nr:hypothetical protein Bca52824_017903 [Brassica carinata]